MIKRKILIVDDDKDLTHLTSLILKDRDYDVDVAHTGKEALEKVKHIPDIILLDRTLPDMEGLEICRQIREDHRFKGIPIIVVSGLGKLEDKIEGLYIGADDYLTKPFDPEELVARLDAIYRRIEFAEHFKTEKERYVTELIKILENKSITSFFQPIFSFKDFEPIGFESYGRPPKKSELSNPEFMFKVAINSGKYFELEMLCWRKAFSQWAKFPGEGKLFLNCSPYLIESGKFNVDIFRDVGIQPDNTILELTERSAIHDYSLFVTKLTEARKAGLEVAVDDVGCGYASLNMVAELKPDYLKIDLPLIRSIHKDQLKQDIVEAIVHFSKKSGMKTIAEGIEYKEELAMAIELGIDAGQGYLLAKPSQEFITESSIKV